MALHIQMSEEALAELRRTALLNKISSMGLCLGVLLLFGGILFGTVLIIQGEIPAEFISYTPPAEDGPPTNNPIQQQLTSKTSTPSPTVTPSVIVATNASAAVAAPVSIDTTGEIEFDGMDIDLDVSADLGDALGEGGAGMGGTAGGSALQGTFYDLKLTRSGTPSAIVKGHYTEKRNKDGKREITFNTGHPEVIHRVTERLNDYFTSNKKNAFANYYKSSESLYASSFLMAPVDAGYATFAYKVKDICKPAAWVCVYQGRVRAPKSGKFRFVGIGDDFLGVRFNDKIVLEAGYILPSLWEKDSIDSFKVDTPEKRKAHWDAVKRKQKKGFEGYEQVKLQNIDLWNSNVGGLTVGRTFDVEEGRTYPIQIVISEIPGGAFGYCLLIEEVTNGKKPANVPYDLFRTNFSLPTEQDIRKLLREGGYAPYHNSYQAPPYNTDSPIWTAVP